MDIKTLKEYIECTKIALMYAGGFAGLFLAIGIASYIADEREIAMLKRRKKYLKDIAKLKKQIAESDRVINRR